VLELIAAASLTTLATGLGAIPVFMLGSRAAALRPALLGVAAGVMAVASVLGLIVPAFDEGGTAAEVGAGIVAGVAFLLIARRWVHGREHLPFGAGRTSLLVFGVLLVHSLPEGFAIGTAYASNTEGLALFVVVAIAIHNIPEGTSIAVPMAAEGQSAARQFWAAVLTSVPQPVGAVIAYLLVQQITALLPLSFGFAAGAMLALVVVELLPEGWRDSAPRTLAGCAAGIAAMVALSSALDVSGG
jgi:zinc transporter, ZIP family